MSVDGVGPEYEQGLSNKLELVHIIVQSICIDFREILEEKVKS